MTQTDTHRRAAAPPKPAAPPRNARAEDGPRPPRNGTAATAAAWRTANRQLLAKTLGEFCFEDILTARPVEDAAPGGDARDAAPGREGRPAESRRHRIELAGGVVYEFTARPGAFGWPRVDPDSITRTGAGMLGNEIAAPAWDALCFFTDAADSLGTDAATLATYLTELSSTLDADARRIAEGGERVDDLLALDHAALDCLMTGHNWLVANKGRVGFSASDVRRYAPEAAEPVRLEWLAVHRGLAEFRGTSRLSERAVREHELDAGTIARFTRALTDRSLDPDAYVWMPAHPWQWDHAVRIAHAGDVAQGRIVHLGPGPDAYLPGQSIRTMANQGEPTRYDVKLPLKILNTLVWRGIPPHCAMGAPVVTEWLRGLLDRDPFLAEKRTVFLGELASVTVRHPYLSHIDGVPYQHLETLGCIWREPVAAHRDPGERVRTFASLLHTDSEGVAFTAALVRSSGLPAEEWLSRLFATLLDPILHVLYTYGVTFNPHGQNTLIGYDGDDVPVRLYLKDFVDDVCVSFTDVPERGPEPDGHDHVLPRKHPSVIKQHVMDQIFVGHFRYLAPLCADQLGVPEPRFWALARRAITDFQARFPALRDRFAEYDLLAERIPRYALNRDRLIVTRYTDRALRHALHPNGTLPNPLAAAGAAA